MHSSPLRSSCATPPPPTSSSASIKPTDLVGRQLLPPPLATSLTTTSSSLPPSRPPRGSALLAVAERLATAACAPRLKNRAAPPPVGGARGRAALHTLFRRSLTAPSRPPATVSTGGPLRGRLGPVRLQVEVAVAPDHCDMPGQPRLCRSAWPLTQCICGLKGDHCCRARRRRRCCSRALARRVSAHAVAASQRPCPRRSSAGRVLGLFQQVVDWVGTARQAPGQHALSFPAPEEIELGSEAIDIGSLLPLLGAGGAPV